MDSTTIYQEVAKHYNAAAKAGSLTNAQAIAKEFGYTTDDLQVVPRMPTLGSAAVTLSASQISGQFVTSPTACDEQSPLLTHDDLGRSCGRFQMRCWT